MDSTKTKVEKMAVNIQDEHKPQDALVIKRQNTRRFSLLGDTRPAMVTRGTSNAHIHSAIY